MAKPTIVIVQHPDWSAAIHQQLDDRYNLIHYDTRGGYLNLLIEQHAAFVLVDGALPNWQDYTTAPKSSPATRRIPLALITTDGEQRSYAAVKGADITLTPDELTNSAARLVEQYARIPDPERQKQLECECEEPLPPLAIQGIEKFNNGEYYPQHDLFEEQWMQTDGPVRDLYRAILQVGVAYYQIERGNYRAALKMLQRSVQWLLVLPDVCQGVNVAKLRDDSFRVRAELERLGPERLDEFDHDLIQGVEWHPD